MFHGTRKMALLKYSYKHIKPSKEERIQNILHNPNGPLVATYASNAKRNNRHC